MEMKSLFGILISLLIIISTSVGCSASVGGNANKSQDNDKLPRSWIIYQDVKYVMEEYHTQPEGKVIFTNEYTDQEDGISQGKGIYRIEGKKDLYVKMNDNQWNLYKLEK
jgi:hypothetical protein